jgi:hypothetical protein
MKKILSVGAMAIAFAIPNVQAAAARPADNPNYEELERIAYDGYGYEGSRFASKEEHLNAFEAEITKRGPGYARTLSQIAGPHGDPHYKKHAIHLAAQVGSVGALNHLTEGMSPDETLKYFKQQDDDHQTILALAHQTNNTDFVRAMFAKLPHEHKAALIEHTTSQGFVPEGIGAWLRGLL